MIDHAADAAMHERGFFGAVIFDHALLRAERDGLGIDDFDDAKHRHLWRAITTLDEAGQEVCKTNILAELLRTGELESAGGAAYLTSLIDDTGPSTQGAWYADRIRSHAARRAIRAEGQRIADAALNGHTREEFLAAVQEHQRFIAEHADKLVGTPRYSTVDLYSPEIVPRRPEFAVANLIRRAGLHLIWAEPSGGKTWTLLRWLHELLVDTGCGRLAGHPELWINRRFERALWVATEEDAETLRYKADYIRRGLEFDESKIVGKIDYVFAATTRRRVTLDDLTDLLDAGPYGVVILDSLTGLRPKTVNGERVRWDVDNDAANEQCIRLRALATERQIAIILVHHTGRDTSKGYRGPTDWWASADVMVGFVPDAGRAKVIVEKNRDGKRLAPFYLTPTWEGDSYTLSYDGAAVAVKLTPTAEKVAAWWRGRGQASQADATAAGLGARSTIQGAIRALLGAGMLRDTGNTSKTSPIYAWVPTGAEAVSVTARSE
jgi:hypothetical protein